MRARLDKLTLLQGHCTTWLRYGIAASRRALCLQEAPLGERISSTPRCPPSASTISYTLIRHVGLILDELSSQGLEVWQDERQCWRWRWLGAEIQAERGFWSIGEAIVDAVVTRFPAAFDTQEWEERRAT
jgi:hypothetical protein